MSLAGKQSTKFYVTTGSGADKIDSTRKTELDILVGTDAAKGNDVLINDNILGPVIVNIQKMQDDIDELRRFVVSNDNKPLVYSKIDITSTEMASLNITRKTLVAAPGTGKMIVPVRAMILCQKLNGSAANSTLTNLSLGYYHNDNRDISRLPVMQTLGLLHMARQPATYNMVPGTNPIYNIGIGYGENKELALVLSAAPGSNGATTSQLQLLYYIADVT
jgi:hypothetical protein|tara:strand:+ start:124 stop:783 length:660 start_codon:yes stop_codon:yes gene_type:complete